MKEKTMRVAAKIGKSGFGDYLSFAEMAEGQGVYAAVECGGVMRFLSLGTGTVLFLNDKDLQAAVPDLWKSERFVRTGEKVEITITKGY